MAGSPSSPNRIAVALDGTLYVSHAAGIAKFSSNQWSDITPPADKNPYIGITVDPTNASIVMATRSLQGSNPVYRSTNGGLTWTSIAYTATADVPWWGASKGWNNALPIFIDPTTPNRVWHCGNAGVWRTDDITANPSVWYTRELGHEEVECYALKSPPSGAILLSGVADNTGFHHTNLDVFPSAQDHLPLGPDTSTIDFCESVPTTVCRAGGDWGKGTGIGSYSLDGGQTWAKYGSLPQVNGADAMDGKLAVSATNPNLLVWMPAGSDPFYSSDLGTTWYPVTGAPTSGAITNGLWSANEPIASDRVDGSKFYVYVAGTFYRSTDGGATFSSVCTTLPNVSSCEVKALPGQDGEVWVALGTSGLYRSTDAGTTFTAVANVQAATLFAFGKAAGTSTRPAVYVYGTVNGVAGIFRSDDDAQSWTRIDIASEAVGDNPKTMEGDRLVFGRVFVGTSGRGIQYAQPR
jgi:hypothetical protein